MAELQVKIVSDSSGGKETVRSLKEIKAAAAANETQFQRTGAAGTASAASIARGTRVAAQAQLVMTAALERNRALLLTQARGGFLQSIQRGAASALEGVQRLTASISTKLQPALRLIGLAAAAAFGFAIKGSVKFEETMSRITGLVGIAADEVKGFEKPLLDIAKATAKGPNELAEALFFITSAGARGDKALRILDASARAASAGLGSTKVVADAVTSAVNAYGEANLTAAQSTDILVATVREGKAAAEEIAGAIGPVLPIATQLGVTFDQVGATIAALTRVGLNASESQVALKATLNALSKPGKEAIDTLKALSEQNLGVAVSFDDVRKVLREDGLIAALQLLQNATGGNTQELQKIFPNIRAGAGVFSLLGKNAAQVEQIFKRMTDTTGSADDAFAAFAATTSFDVKQSLVAIQLSFKKIADELLPATAKAFVTLASAVEKTVAAFTGLGEVVAMAISGADDPYIRLLNEQRELSNEIDNLTLGNEIITGFDALGNAIKMRTGELSGFDKASTALINRLRTVGQVELSGDFENQLRQLRERKSEIDKLVQATEKEKLVNDRITTGLRDQQDIIEEIIVEAEKPVSLIDTDLLEKGEKALSDLRGEVVLMVADLANLTSLGQSGIGLAEDAAEAESLFNALQGRVQITKDEVIELVRQKRALADGIDAVTEALDNQKSAVQTVKDLQTSITDITAQLAAATSGGLPGLFQTQALQQAQLIMRDLGADTGFTVEQIQQLILQEMALKDALGEVSSVLKDSKTDFEIFKEFAIQAARNVQSAFAEFLFDPFEDGLDGLLRSFGETLRKMASEVLAQQILTSFLSAIGGGGSNIFGAVAGAISSNAAGGNFKAGETMLVGEEGPELITSKTGGTVLSNADTMKSFGASQAAPIVNVSPAPVIVVDDPRKVEEALQSANGQRALIAAISEKSNAVNQALGRNR